MKCRFLLMCLLTSLSGFTATAAEPIAIGSRLEPLVDDYLIDTMTGARLVLNRPTPREVAIVHDAPWEGSTCYYHTVFQDGDIYRMYYRGSDHNKKNTHQVACYAESPDGIHWTKPELGLFEFGGSKKNNIVWSGPGADTFAPFRDTNPACKPDEKYKALATLKTSPTGGLLAFKSPDGIHWSLLREKPVITDGWFDSLNVAFWDTVRGCYVEFHRDFRGENNAIMRREGAIHPLQKPETVRDIRTCTSTDFVHWSKPVWLEYPGAPREHLYTNQITPYYRAPHILMGFPKRFMPERSAPAIPHGGGDGVSDGVFMTSRDGRTFHRWGEALIRPGLQKERWVNRNNMTAWGIVVTKSDVPGTPNELSIYSIEGYFQGNDSKLRRHTVRIDGFVSVQAPLAGGQFVTRPITFDGKQLAINYSTSAAGSVQVEIQDAAGKPIPGFTLADCPEIFGDAIQQVVAWNGGSDLRQLAGKPVRLRFVLKDADLYSIRFR